MFILGISCHYHDSAAVILADGVLIAAAEEERFSRIKHDSNFPEQAIAFCLEQTGITAQDLDYVVYYEKPLQKFLRILQNSFQIYPHAWPIFRESMVTWFNEKLWIKGEILTHLDIPQEKLLFVDHHISHAASAFFCSPFEDAAILTVDGVGEWTTATVGQGKAVWPERNSVSAPSENSIRFFNEIRYPHSLGLLYSTFTAFLGFRVNNGEYKVMGMAPYGRPNRLDDIYKIVNVGDDGSIRMNMDYFDYHRSVSRMYNNNFIRLFGSPRVHESTFYTPTTHPTKNHPDWNDETAKINQAYADIAASIQRFTEDTLLKMANYAYERTGSKNLCLAGGVALNSVANGRILRESPFEELYIQPAAGDSGGALGAALYAYHVVLGQPRKFVMEHAYYGRAYSENEIRTAIDDSGYSFERLEDEEKQAASIVDDLLAGRVISLFQKQFEWGPRALGNRSILADPRSAEMKHVVNERIKFREPFRPFAPVVLEEAASNYYDELTEPERHYPLRFMLMVYMACQKHAHKIQAVTHEGGSGRVQTVRREWNPLYYRAVELFGEATGVPVLLNTSFNLRGEPIVNTPANALNTFGKSDIDTLYMDGFVVRKNRR